MRESFSCKVCRVLAEHDVSHYDERMVDMWTGDVNQRKGYRKIARWLNVTLLQREMDRAGLPTLAGEAESKFERLQNETQERHEVRSLLEQHGIDVDTLEKDFVSYGVIRTHLNECLGKAYTPPQAGSWERDSIEIARNHASRKVESAVSSLINKEKLETVAAVNVNADFNIECERCHSKISVDRAVRRGYVCQCVSDDQ